MNWPFFGLSGVSSRLVQSPVFGFFDWVRAVTAPMRVPFPVSFAIVFLSLLAAKLPNRAVEDKELPPLVLRNASRLQPCFRSNDQISRPRRGQITTGKLAAKILKNGHVALPDSVRFGKRHRQNKDRESEDIHHLGKTTNFFRPTLLSVAGTNEVRPAIVKIDPEIMSGEPCFAGTRVPIQNLIDYLEGGDSIDQFLEDFPSVSRDQVLEEARDHMLAIAVSRTPALGGARFATIVTAIPSVRSLIIFAIRDDTAVSLARRSRRFEKAAPRQNKAMACRRARRALEQVCTRAV